MTDTVHKVFQVPAPSSQTILAKLDSLFEGRFFAVGNPHTNEVWGTVGTFNQAIDELIQAESCGNAGNGCDVLEVDADGKPINVSLSA